MKLNEQQKDYIRDVGLDAADEDVLNALSDNGGQKFDIDGWDGVYKDLDSCGEDVGYPPGSEGAIAWEKANPGKKVVDWLGRDENAPEYTPVMDGADDGSDDAIASDDEYRRMVDEVNAEAMRRYGLKIKPFNYDCTDNLDMSTDPTNEIYETYADELRKLYYRREKANPPAGEVNGIPLFDRMAGKN